jgi:RHS repeat-associated protein
LGQTGSGLEERLHYTNDANFNVTALVDTSGNVVERYLYDAYGKPKIYDAPWANTILERSSKANSIRFCGYVYDGVVKSTGEWTSNLYHVRHRTYHPTLGRWLQRDPAGYVDGMGLYEYCGGNAPARIDPQGTDDVGLTLSGLASDMVTKWAAEKLVEWTRDKMDETEVIPLDRANALAYWNVGIREERAAGHRVSENFMTMFKNVKLTGVMNAAGNPVRHWSFKPDGRIGKWIVEDPQTLKFEKELYAEWEQRLQRMDGDPCAYLSIASSRDPGRAGSVPVEHLVPRLARFGKITKIVVYVAGAKQHGADMARAIQHAKMTFTVDTIIASRHINGQCDYKTVYKMKLEDEYDFDWYPTKDCGTKLSRTLWIANNLGAALQKRGWGKPFTWDVEWEGSVVTSCGKRK